MRGIPHLAVLAVFIAVAGCYVPLEKPEGYSHKLRQPEFQDIPVPYKGGYEYIESESFTYVAPASDSLRVAKLKIIGDTRVDEIVEFYKRQMELHGFKLKKEFPSKEVHKTVLTFEKIGNNEECEIEVQRDGTRVVIMVRLYPV